MAPIGSASVRPSGVLEDHALEPRQLRGRERKAALDADTAWRTTAHGLTAHS